MGLSHTELSKTYSEIPKPSSCLTKTREKTNVRGDPTVLPNAPSESVLKILRPREVQIAHFCLLRV